MKSSVASSGTTVGDNEGPGLCSRASEERLVLGGSFLMGRLGEAVDPACRGGVDSRRSGGRSLWGLDASAAVRVHDYLVRLVTQGRVGLCRPP